MIRLTAPTTKEAYRQFVLYSGNELCWGWNISVRITSKGTFESKGRINIKHPTGNNILVEHHTKYEEVHGVDETTWITQSQHVALHKRLRREGKCNFPPEELDRISTAANHRTQKNKVYMRAYLKRYNKTHRKELNKYRREKQRRINFYETIVPGILLYEHLTYNINTGNICWCAFFRAEKGRKLFKVQERL